MQEKDTEALQNQRRRRKRISRIKSAIVTIIAGWICLSMVLIIFLLVRTISMERRLDAFLRDVSSESVNRADVQLESEDTEAVQGETSQTVPEIYAAAVPGVPLASGIEDEENLAGDGDVHRVYLTFDDGPSENTGAILDILAEYDVKATFFVVGREDEESKELYRRIVEEGHTLGMHSYTNRYSEIYQSKEAFIADYERLRDYLYEVTGVESRYYRFPGGSSNQISNVPMSSLISFLNGESVVYYDWNVTAGDAASAAYTAEEIVENVTDDVVKYKTSVVLLHDSSDKLTTVEAIRPLLDALIEMDAELLPIDETTQVIQYVKADNAG